jgi:pimeloyl-ACP methyl ester carboxylesterase
VRDRMVVFGGYSYDYDGLTYSLNDVWALSLAGTPAWTELSPSDGVPGRYAHSAIYDPARDRMVVFGGSFFDNIGPVRDRMAARQIGYFNDVWALSLTGTAAWTELAPSTQPPARSGHSAIYDPVRDRMVVFNGSSGLNDLLALEFTTPVSILEPDANTFWLTGASDVPFTVRWSTTDSRFHHATISVSTDGRHTWWPMATNVSIALGTVTMGGYIAAADTVGALVKMEVYDEGGHLLSAATGESQPFAVGNNNSIRLDVQRNNESQFSPPVLFWEKVEEAGSYQVGVFADGLTSCSSGSWGPVVVPATRQFRVIDRDAWEQLPASRYSVWIVARDQSGLPIGLPAIKSFVRFKLSDLDPGDNESKPPVLLVHGWTSDQATWSTCGGSPLIQRLIAGPGTPRHPWAIDYPNMGPIQHSAAGLVAALEHLRRTTSGAPPVSIIAHSMGGVVSRAAIEGLALDPGTGQPRTYTPGSVLHLATLSSPHLGEPNTGTASWLKGVLRLCPNLDRSQSFSDLDHTSTFIRLLNETPLPGIRFLFCAGTRDECDLGGTSFASSMPLGLCRQAGGRRAIRRAVQCRERQRRGCVQRTGGMLHARHHEGSREAR